MSRHPATPGCPCERCRAVFDEWSQQAVAFQAWYVRFGHRYLVEKKP